MNLVKKFCKRSKRLSLMSDVNYWKPFFFQKIQIALSWLLAHVKLTFVIPADCFLTIIHEFCSKSRNTCESIISLEKFLLKGSSGLVKCSFDNPAKFIAPNIQTVSAQVLFVSGKFYSSQKNCFQAKHYLAHILCSSEKLAGSFLSKVQRVSVGILKWIMEFFSWNFPSKWLFGHVDFSFANPVGKIFASNVCDCFSLKSEI